MGVQGLWRLLMPIGRRISMETLEGKILAIDASIWITQFLLAMRDPETGNARPTAPLIGILRRLCKLRFHGIRPVLVFDGATPEVKQRELHQRRQRRRERLVYQDGTPTALGDSVQRIAKRLLAQQLKNGGASLAAALRREQKNNGKTKENNNGLASTNSSVSANDSQKKQPSSSGGQAPGFYDPEAMDDVPSKTEETTEETKEVRLSSTEGMDVQDDLLDTVFEEDRSSSPPPNDWDDPPVPSTTDPTSGTNGGKMESEEDSDNPFALRTESGGAKILAQSTINQNGELDVEYVASMPSTQRKELVETAHRERRLQSRREFMKVANDPQGLSSCQLRNFLKYAKLNRDVHTMAQKAAATEYQDVSRRIVLETTNVETGKLESVDLQSQRVDTAYPKKGGSKDDNSEADSDEGGGFLPQSPRKPKSQPDTKQRAITALVDSEDDSDVDGEHEFNDDTAWREGDAGVPHSHSNNSQSGDQNAILGQDAKAAQEMQDEILARALQEEEEEGGGFLRPENGDNDSMANHSSSTTGRRREDSKPAARPLASSSQDSDIDECDWEDCGVATSSSVAYATNAHASTHLTDSQKAQELQDELLARALQDEEDNSGGGFLQQHDTRQRNDEDSMANHSSGSMDGGWREDSKPHAREMPREIRKHRDTGDFLVRHTSASQNREERPTLSALMSFQESRDEMLARSLQQEEDSQGGFLSPEKSSTVEIIDVDTKESMELDKAAPAVPTNSAPSDDDDDDDESCDWEDGDDQEVVELPRDSVPGLENSKTNGVHANANGALNSEEENKRSEDKVESTSAKESPKNDTNQDPVVELEEEDEEKMVDDDESTGGFEDENPFASSYKAREKSQQEMADVLHHAQATAARLTDWAGRAFRRAISQHAEESGMTAANTNSPAKLPPVVEVEGEKEKSGPPAKTAEEPLQNDDKPPTEEIVDNNAILPAAAFHRKDGSAPIPGDDGALADHAPTTMKNTSQEDMVADFQEYQRQYDQGQHRRPAADPMDTGDLFVSDELRADVMQLLRLFGIPYIQAPAEAEAQCVELERLGLVDGIVTEDSDALVFGGQRVYKNIFEDQKYVEVYDAGDAAKEMNLTRDGLVGLAMLLGGDYTEGVRGVGIVNGMEIVQAFDVSDNVQEGLESFRKWLDGFDVQDILGVEGQERRNQEQMDLKTNAFHRSHHAARMRWIAPKYFPDPKILNAYLHPVVDTNEDRFTWGTPDIESLIHFCNQQMGWSAEETHQLIDPVVERLNTQGSSMRQMRVDSYFMRYEDGIKFANVRSKRLQSVLQSLQDEKSGNKKQKRKK
eukprot:Nitzschia sp. Nitz4//scaffold154_size52827//42360//46286//NITZ4_006785-RA/size52827-processed-gene-0.90-mRNA-1//-1//CDS//3329537335//1798//frame0